MKSQAESHFRLSRVCDAYQHQSRITSAQLGNVFKLCTATLVSTEPPPLDSKLANNDAELVGEATVRNFRRVRTEGTRWRSYKVKRYNGRGHGSLKRLFAKRQNSLHGAVNQRAGG